jgi:hypothetical protein
MKTHTLWQTVSTNALWAARFWLINTLILTLLLSLYRLQLPEGSSRWDINLYLSGAQFSQAGAFALLSCLSLLTLSWLPKPLFRALSVMLATAVFTILLADTQVFSHYRFHINGVILDMVFNGGSEIFQLSWVTWACGLVALLVVVLLQWGTASLVRRPLPKGMASLTPVMWVVVSLTCHFWHAVADARYDDQLTATNRYLPLYYPMTAKRAMDRLGWVNLDEHREETSRLIKQSPSQDLHYPKIPLGEATATPNVLMVVIDTWRADALTARATPNIHRLANGDNSLRFNDHFSGGNSTQAGMFSLFYGLPATYWEGFAHARQRPVLMEILDSLNYQIGIFQSSTIVSPAFDRTLYQGVSGLQSRRPGERPWQRDLDATQEMKRFLTTRDPSRSFFGLLFLDGVHGYDFPEDKPLAYPDYLKRVDHLALNKDTDPKPYFRRYLNAVHYSDQLVGQVLTLLGQQGRMEDTIVVITSDHGEEFNDSGQNYWGHGSNYSVAQLKVPLVIHWPGKKAKIFEQRTSHLDLVPTLVQDALGISSEPKSYSEGNNLLTASDYSWLVAASYSDFALVGKSAMMVVQPTGLTQVLRPNLTPAPKNAIDPRILLNQLEVLSRFYR